MLPDAADLGWYSQRKTYEEKGSFLYLMIKMESFVIFIDIGSNYGYISLIMTKPDMKIISIEADPRLVDYTQRNFELNNVNQPIIINLIVGYMNKESHLISLNLKSTIR